MREERVRRIFLCRHGETEANVKKIYCGGSRETPLTENGKIQAMLLGKALRNQYYFCGRYIISSNLGRAQETADKISLNFDYPLIKTTIEDFRELDMGDWCGKKWDEIQRKFPKESKKWRKGKLTLNFCFPGGESLKEYFKRINEAFRTITKDWLKEKRESAADLIIVAHGGTNMAILAEILGITKKNFNFRAMRQENACINIIKFYKENIWRPKEEVALINGTDHLYFHEEKAAMIMED